MPSAYGSGPAGCSAEHERPIVPSDRAIESQPDQALTTWRRRTYMLDYTSYDMTHLDKEQS